MNAFGTHTRAEILSQPAVWLETLQSLHSQADELRRFFEQGAYDEVLFTGCGSTYYLSLAAAALFQDLTGVAGRGLPSSEIWLSPRSVWAAHPRALLVAVSRSGETTETLYACDAFRQVGAGDILTLTCYPGTHLAQVGALNLVFAAAQEESVAQTRAFSTLYLATTVLGILWGGRDDLFEGLERLPEIGCRLLEMTLPMAQRVGSRMDLDRFYFLGSSMRYGLACELSLKMKEMSLSHSEPFHFLEFRHGPVSMITPGSLIIGLVSQTNHSREKTVLSEMAAKGASVLTMAEQDADVAFESGLDERLCGIFYLPAGQLIALERALAKGLDPDQPNNLTAVVRLSSESKKSVS